MANNMVIAININLEEVAHTQAMAEILRISSAAGIAFQVVQAGAPVAQAAQVSAPVSEHKTKSYADPVDTAIRLVVDKASVTYTAIDGKYLGTSGLRKALNARLRQVATFDTTTKSWKFKSAKAASEWAANETTSHFTAETLPDGCVYATIVTAQEWADVRAKAAKRAEKKA